MSEEITEEINESIIDQIAEERVKELEEASGLALDALEKTPIYVTSDGVWINSRTKGSAMIGLQDISIEEKESFVESYTLNQNAVCAVRKVLGRDD